MAKLSRIHFAGMGNPAARFNPLTLDFRGASGSPAHSVLWLRNGGGKTTMLSLFYSVILPSKREWLGKFHEKPTQLSDYMFDREVGYIIIEFAFADGSKRIVGQALVKRSADEVSRICFTCASGGPVTLESLPVVGLTATPAKTREAFFDHLEAENRRRPKEVDLFKFDLAHGYSDWERHLIAIGVDPAVYRTHLVMNSDEGGLGEFFNFKTSDKFLEKLLEMADEPTVLPDDASGADQAEAVVDKFRSKVLGMPDLEKEGRFCQQIIDGANQYRVALDAVVAANLRLKEARVAASKALFSVQTCIRDGTERLSQLDLLLKKAGNDLQAAESIINTHGRYRSGYERLGANLRHQEAVRAHGSARLTDERAAIDLVTLRAAERLANFDYWAAEVRARHQALSDLQAERLPELIVVRNLGTTLWRRLNGQVTEIGAAIGILEEAIRKNTGDIRTARQDQSVAGEELRKFQRALAVVNENLKNFERERRALRESGLIADGEAAPDASSRWQGEMDRLEEQLNERRSEVAKSRSDAKTLRGEAKRQFDAAAAEKKASESLRSILQAAAGAESELRCHRVVQQHGGHAADLHNPGLLQAIQAQVDSYSAEIMSAGVSRASDERILARHAPPARPTFPVAVAIERVLELLRVRGVRSALPRYEWIAANCGFGEAEQLLRDNPAAASGIMLQDPAELPLVTQVTSADGLDSPVTVSLASAHGRQEIAGHVIIPAERGYFNAESAAANRGLIQERVNASRQEQDRLMESRKEAERLSDRLRSYASTYPAERLRQVKEDADRHDASATSLLTAARGAETQADAADERANAMQEDMTRIASLKGEALRKKSQVDKYIVDFHNKVEGWRAAERQAAEGTQAQENALRELGTRIERLEAANEGHRDTLTQRRSDHSQARLHRDEVPENYRDGDAIESDMDLATLEAEFRLKRQAFEKALSESGLPESIRLAEQAKKRDEGAYYSFLTAQRLQDADVRAVRDLHPNLSVALNEQQRTSDDARKALTLAESEMQSATAALAAFPPLLRDQRSTLHPEWGEMTTRAEADAAAAKCRDIEQQAREAKEAAQGEITRVKDAISAAKEVGNALRPWVSELENRTPGFVADQGHPDFRAEVEAIGALMSKVRAEVDAQSRRHGDAERTAERLLQDKIMSVLNDGQFASARMDSRVRLLELANAKAQFDHQLPEIIANLTSRVAVIAHSRAAIEAEREIVMSAMERRGASSLSLLRSAQNLSEMPQEIGAWAGHCFMRFSFTEKKEQTERRSYLRRLLDYWIDTNVAIPSGHHMAFDCMLALVGSLDAAGKPQLRGAIGVEILKPEANLRFYYHDILAMRTFSGGELVTAAIILYCVMARLRAKRRGADVHIVGRDSGFLLLDNPVGKANLPDFLDLQIRIADIVGVQYICGTGINDIEALGAFPKVIRLRNSTITRSGAYAVKLEKELFNAVSAVAISARTPVLAEAKQGKTS